MKSGMNTHLPRTGLSPQQQGDQSMLGAGMDILPDRRSLANKRSKKGECPTCGLKTHKVGLLGGKKPLTVEGLVYNGQCMNCYPIEGYTRRPPPASARLVPPLASSPLAPPLQFGVPVPAAATTTSNILPPSGIPIPRTLEVMEYHDDDDDGLSVMSGLTMDVRLIQGARNWNYAHGTDEEDDNNNGDEYDSDEQDFQANGQGLRRPEASVGGDDPYQGGRPDPSHNNNNNINNMNQNRLQPRPPPGGTMNARELGGGRKAPPRAVSPIQEGGGGGGRYMPHPHHHHLQQHPQQGILHMQGAAMPVPVPQQQQHQQHEHVFGYDTRQDIDHLLQSNFGKGQQSLGSVSSKSQSLPQPTHSQQQQQQQQHIFGYDTQQDIDHILQGNFPSKPAAAVVAPPPTNEIPMCLNHAPNVHAHAHVQLDTPDRDRDDRYQDDGYQDDGYSDHYHNNNNNNNNKTPAPQSLDPHAILPPLTREISFNPATLNQNKLGLLREDADSPPTMPNANAATHQSHPHSPHPPLVQYQSIESGPMYNDTESAYFDQGLILRHAAQGTVSSSLPHNTHTPRSDLRPGQPGPEFYCSLERASSTGTPPPLKPRDQRGRPDDDAPIHMITNNMLPPPTETATTLDRDVSEISKPPAPQRYTSDVRRVGIPLMARATTPEPSSGLERFVPRDDHLLYDDDDDDENHISYLATATEPQRLQSSPSRSASPPPSPPQPARAITSAGGMAFPGLQGHGSVGIPVTARPMMLEPTPGPERSISRDGRLLYDDDDDEDEQKVSYKAGATKIQRQRSSQSASPPPSPPQPARAVASTAGVASHGTPSSNQVKKMERVLSARDQFQKEQTIRDIPVVLHCLNMDNEVTPYMREKAFRSLKIIIWKSGLKARMMIQEYKGVDTLVKNMWADMGIASVQEAALQLLFALCASTDGHASSDVLSNEEAICDALLFAMQTHASVEKIQAAGCGILACLAAASANNKSIIDGSLSGALSMVVAAIENHNSSLPLIKAGIQALYSQCALSVNAESNKRSLMDMNGMHVVSHALQVLQDDVVALEWVMKLSWILTGAEDLMWKFSDIPNIIGHILQACRVYAPHPNASELIVAILGVVGNMTYLETNRVEMASAGVVSVVIDAMRYQRNHCDVNIEACAVLANLAVMPSIREEISRAGGVGSVIRALQTYLDQEEIAEEALRALVCLANHSPETKQLLVTPEVVISIARACKTHKSSSLVMELSCSLVATLSAGESIDLDVIIDNGGTEVIARALSCSGEKVQEAACAAFRNLTCKVRGSDELLRSGVQVRQLTEAMSGHENSLSIQTNVCASLWNLAFKTRQDAGSIVDSAGVRSIVKAMQNHMESGDLLEVACGALWSLVDDSYDRKKDVVDDGAIDAVTCALVMHPGRSDTLVKACGVLSNVSFEGPFAEAIANAGVVSIVVEAMRNNSSSVLLLTTCCIVLRNIVVQYPDFVQEASGAVSTTINSMRDYPDEVAFQEESCTLLWILAALSEDVQSKICALDGVTVLMKTLEHNSDVAEVQEAALGAFNQLAATT